jgi:hypothetical protein
MLEVSSIFMNMSKTNFDEISRNMWNKNLRRVVLWYVVKGLFCIRNVVLF